MSDQRKRNIGDGPAAEVTKRKRKEKAALLKDLAAAGSILAVVLARPQSVHENGPFSSVLRAPLLEIVSRQSDFRLDVPPPSLVQGSSSSTASGGGTRSYQLSQKFVETLHRECDTADEPVLQIVAHERRKRMKSKFAAGGEFQVQVRLTVTDGDTTMLAILSTDVVGPKYFIADNIIIKVLGYTCVPYVPEDGASTMIGMLIHKFELVGAGAPMGDKLAASMVPEDVDWGGLPGAPLLGAVANGPALSDPTAATAKNAGDCHGCDGSHCSINGIKTAGCLVARTPVATLEAISADCYFADRAVNEMDNSKKRFLLYWWWAVNVFAIRGKGMRQELPGCVVAEIRSMYPDPNGVYTGFKQVGAGS